MFINRNVAEKLNNLRETLFNPTTLIRLMVCMGRVCRGPTLKWAELTRFQFLSHRQLLLMY